VHTPNHRTTTAAPRMEMPVPALFRPADPTRAEDLTAPRLLGPKPSPVTFSDVRVPTA
jgi:hypothetical protein